jgi:ribA/ribD-fused uncharacterized protein
VKREKKKMPNVINSFRGEYRFLSNFWRAEVEMYGRTYPTVEHAFQAAKTLDVGEREAIRTTANPGDAKRMGRRVTLRKDWDSFRLQAMYMLVKRKFSEHVALKHSLLATGDAELIEGNTWNDRFWGVCRGEGKNHLGKILMQVREELKNG